MRKMSIYCIIMLLSLTFVSCERRSLNEPAWVTARIPVNIKWSDAALDPENDPEQDLYSASVWLFPKGGGEAIEYRLINSRGGTIDVPVGRYDVIVLNNTIREYSSIAFEGTDKFDTFCAKAIPETSNRYILKGSEELFIQQPEILAVWSCRDLVVTQQMVTKSRSGTKGIGDIATQLMNVVPKRLVYSLSLVVHVTNLSSAKSATGIVRGMASGCYLATGEAIPPRAGQAFILNNRKYNEGQSKDGTVDALVLTFGVLSDGQQNSYTLQTDFVLRDDKPFGPIVNNITDRLNSSKPEGGQLKINIAIGVDGEKEIELPKVSTGGLDIELGDWDDEEDIPVEI